MTLPKTASDIGKPIAQDVPIGDGIANEKPEIPDGMVEWHGQTKEPPEDWDGGAYLCRDGKMYFLNGWDWGHGTHCWYPTADWDRIAYTPRNPTPPAQLANIGDVK